MASLQGRSTRQSTDCNHPCLGWCQSTNRLRALWMVDWAVDRQCLTVKNLTVGRSTGRSKLTFSAANDYILRGYKYGFSWAVFNKNFRELFSHLYKYFCSKFLKSFYQKDLFLFCFQGLKKSKKNRVFGKLVFGSLFLSLSSIFPKYFFFVICFSNTLFSHT